MCDTRNPMFSRAPDHPLRRRRAYPAPTRHSPHRREWEDLAWRVQEDTERALELLCKRVAIIDQGKIIALDSVANLIALLGGGVLQIGLHQADEKLLADLGGLPAVKQVTIAETPLAPPPAEGDEPKASQAVPTPAGVVLKIETQDSQQALVNVFAFLNKADITVTSVGILEPNLESVFLHLTGKKLRE